jgi:hypothetical protein
MYKTRPRSERGKLHVIASNKKLRAGGLASVPIRFGPAAGSGDLLTTLASLAQSPTWELPSFFLQRQWVWYAGLRLSVPSCNVNWQLYKNTPYYKKTAKLNYYSDNECGTRGCVRSVPSRNVIVNHIYIYISYIVIMHRGFILRGGRGYFREADYVLKWWA